MPIYVDISFLPWAFTGIYQSIFEISFLYCGLWNCIFHFIFIFGSCIQFLPCFSPLAPYLGNPLIAWIDQILSSSGVEDDVASFGPVWNKFRRALNVFMGIMLACSWTGDAKPVSIPAQWRNIFSYCWRAPRSMVQSAITNGRYPESCLGRVFNSWCCRFPGCRIAILHSKCMAIIVWPLLKLKQGILTEGDGSVQLTSSLRQPVLKLSKKIFSM